MAADTKPPGEAVAVFWQRPVDDIPLEEVARRAGVSLQTVIRRFGGKQELLAAARPSWP